MACVISRDGVRLFISYAPGTGSTSLEQHLRTYDHLLRTAGFVLTHYPAEAFGEGGDISRHICYEKYTLITGERFDYVATGARHPFSYYFAEYNRILRKWSKLLDDPKSWIYSQESKATLELAAAARLADSFDIWFFDILNGQLGAGYMVINGDHMVGASHFIKTESMTEDLDKISRELFHVELSTIIGMVPVVNTTDYSGHYASYITEKTKSLGLSLFRKYMAMFGYSYEDPG